MAAYQLIRTAQSNDYALYDLKDDGSFYKVSDNATTYDLAGQNEMKGYLFKVRYSGGEVVQNGTLNNTDLSISLQSEWQIIANPYSSYYELPLEAAAGADFENTTGTVYVTISTRNSDKRFETYNTLTGISSPEKPKGVVAPNQAFYVKTLDPTKKGQHIRMWRHKRIHDTHKASLKTNVKEQNILRLQLDNGTYNDEMVVALRDNGQDGVTRLDSEKRIEGELEFSLLYALVEDKKLVINVLPLEVQDKSVAIGIQPKLGSHTIRIKGIESLTKGYVIMLEDKLTGQMVEMNSNTEYEFIANQAENNERFVLHFKQSKTEVPTDVHDGADTDNKVSVYIRNNRTLTVNCPWQGDKHVRLFTVKGRLVESGEFKNEHYTKEVHLQPGIYIVKIIGDSDEYEQKIFVN